MSERPILFSAPMVRAILAGTKTQTRRVVALREFGRSDTAGYDWTFRDRRALWNDYRDADFLATFCPHGRVGDTLWVRESWYATPRPTKELLGYVADGDHPHGCSYRVVPSIHMPRRYARILLRVTSVSVERVQEISEGDAKAEGLIAQEGGGLGRGPGFKWYGTGYHGGRMSSWGRGFHTPKHDGSAGCSCAVGGTTPAQCAFQELWDSINEKRGYGWDVNPWVWVISFERKD